MQGDKETLVTLKISVDTPEGVPTIWRELELCGDSSLSELSGAIMTSFGWSGIHKHEFVAADGSWKATDPQYGPPEFDDSYKSEEEILIQDVAGKKGPALTYNYDLTDPWAHTIEVTGVKTGDFAHQRTKLIGGARNGIPEDCGGASGFQEFLEAVQDPEDPEHKAMLAWYKTECPNGAPAYDPDRIDFDSINKKLASWSSA